MLRRISLGKGEGEGEGEAEGIGKREHKTDEKGETREARDETRYNNSG